MTSWYFLIFVMLVAGEPSGKPIIAFTNVEACVTAGNEATARERAEPTPRQGYWECLGIDFDVADPLLRGPVHPEEPKRLPARPPGQHDA